jgi:hypothetical protein
VTAGTNIANAYVTLIPTMVGAQAAVSRVLAPAAATAGTEAGRVAGKSMGGSFGGTFKALAVTAVAAGLISGAKASVESLARIERINAQTESAIKSTGGAAGVSAKQVEGLAGALEKKTATEAESIQEGANLLLTFKNIKNEAGAGNDVFNQTVTSMTDMARAMGTDASGSAIQLGKALNDPSKGISALTRVGVSFTDEQKNQVKAMQESGDLMGAQKIILAELQDQFGGSGAAYASTYAGQMDQFSNAVGDLGETIMSKAMPALTTIAQKGAAAFTWLTEHKPALIAAGLLIGGLLTMAFFSWVGGIATATAALWGNVAALAAQGIATGKSVLTTGILLAMYAGSAVKTGIATAAQWALNAALNANPIGLVILAIAALVGALVWFFTKTEIGQRIIQAVWGGIQAAIGGVVSWWTGTAWPAIASVLDWFGQKFQIAGAIVGLVWTGMQVVLSNVWNWVSQNVFEPFKTGVALVGTAFERVRDAIGTAWDGLKAIAAKPVNFILGTVYNDGVREWWNKIANAVGLSSLNLPKASLVQFARGGVMPGYTPGRDIHQFYSPTGGRLALSGGEAIMRPEWTRAVGGPGAVARMNAAARSGRPLGFKDGGVWGWFGDAWDTVKNIGKGIWDAGAMALEVVKDPVGAVKRAVVDGLINPIMQRVGVGGDFVKVLTQLPIQFAHGLADKVKSMLGIGGGPGGGGGKITPGAGVGIPAMTAMLNSLGLGARVNSGFRAGAKTAGFGATSFHALGRAIDIGGPNMMAIFNALDAAYGARSQELLYTPAGARQILRGGRRGGTSGVTAANHYSHVHWAMHQGGVVPKLFDGGGWMMPNDIGLNRTRSPEPVFTNRQWSILEANLTTSGRGEGPLVEQLIVRDERTAIEELEALRRREATRARLTGVLR